MTSTAEPANISPDYLRAKRRVAMLKAFYLHCAVYALVNVFLFLLNLSTGGAWWFYWPAFGWGIGVAAHAGVVWGGPHVRTWEEEMIQREMRREPRFLEATAGIFPGGGPSR
jgi:hypothetical protein